LFSTRALDAAFTFLGKSKKVSLTLLKKPRLRPQKYTINKIDSQGKKLVEKEANQRRKCEEKIALNF